MERRGNGGVVISEFSGGDVLAALSRRVPPGVAAGSGYRRIALPFMHYERYTGEFRSDSDVANPRVRV